MTSTKDYFTIEIDNHRLVFTLICTQNQDSIGVRRRGGFWLGRCRNIRRRSCFSTWIIWTRTSTNTIFLNKNWFQVRNVPSILTSQGHSSCRVQNSSLHAALQFVSPWHAYKHRPLSTLFSSRHVFQSTFVSLALKIAYGFYFSYYELTSHWHTGLAQSVHPSRQLYSQGQSGNICYVMWHNIYDITYVKLNCYMKIRLTVNALNLHPNTIAQTCTIVLASQNAIKQGSSTTFNTYILQFWYSERSEMSSLTRSNVFENLRAIIKCF